MLVLSTPLAGGAVTTLASTKMADGDQDITLSMGVDESNVYFIDDGAIVSVPLTGGGVETTIASSPQILGSFAFDGENFYWPASSGSDGSTSIVAKVAKSGGAVTTVFSVADAQMNACAVDGTSVYAFYTVSGLVPTGDPNMPAGLVMITPK
jgi:hypothetical protein